MTRVLKLFRYEQASGFVIVAAILLGLIAANSPLSALYDAVHHAPVHVGLGPLVINEPLIGWINEGLMVFFFLLVGLEIKRELLEGHLSTPRSAALPAFAALGGMVVPAAIYAGLNWTDAAAIRGWAIPTATDIVLALGMLSLLGSRVSVSLKVFLTALAIFDDIGAVLIIGLFYGEELSQAPLLIAALAVVALVLINVFRITRPAFYVIVGLVLWVAMLESGVEASLAGVIIALAVPMRAGGYQRSSPVREAERRLQPWCILFVVPAFAFFNSGIAIETRSVADLLGPASLGIMAGLFVGKPLGVLAASWFAVRLGVASLPDGVDWPQICGVAVLAGIGFTMSLFVATLAFPDPAMLSTAKLAVLLASAVSAITGLLWLKMNLGPDD